MDNHMQTQKFDSGTTHRLLAELGTFEVPTDKKKIYIWTPNVPDSKESIVFVYIGGVQQEVAPHLAVTPIQGVIRRAGLDKLIQLAEDQEMETARTHHIGVREEHEDSSLVRFVSTEVAMAGAEVTLHKDKISASMLKALSIIAQSPMEPVETTWVQFDFNVKPVENSLVARGIIDSNVASMVTDVLKEMAELYPEDFHEGNYNAFSHELCNVSSEYRAEEHDGVRLAVSGAVAELPPFIRGYHTEAIRSFLVKTGVAQELGFEWEEFFVGDMNYWDDEESYRVDYFEDSKPLKRVSFEFDMHPRDIEDLLAVLVLTVVPDGWYADFMEKNGIELEDDYEMC